MAEDICYEAQALNLSSLVRYQEGSVVSKTLFKEKAGTLTLFAFASGQGLSEHSAPFAAILQIIEGEAEVTVGGKPIKLKSGELVIMPANIPHSVKAGEAFKMLLTMLKSAAT